MEFFARRKIGPNGHPVGKVNGQLRVAIDLGLFEFFQIAHRFRGKSPCFGGQPLGVLLLKVGGQQRRVAPAATIAHCGGGGCQF